MTRPPSSFAAVVMAAASLCLTPTTAAGQGTRVRVSYDVEFRTVGSLLDQTCAASGTDVLSGTLVGLEPPPRNGDNVYVGTLARTTRISICGTRRNVAGEDVVCGINVAGNGLADVMLTVSFDRRGGWMQYIDNRAQWAQYLPPLSVVPATSSVTGTCDPAELVDLQNEYATGSTGGSPNGQPIEVTGLPPSGLPFTYPAKPPESIWTLTVLARRP